MKSESFSWACEIDGETFEFSVWMDSKCSCCGTEDSWAATLDGKETGRCLCMTCAKVFYNVPVDVIMVMNRIAKEERR